MKEEITSYDRNDRPAGWPTLETIRRVQREARTGREGFMYRTGLQQALANQQAHSAAADLSPTAHAAYYLGFSNGRGF
jgi:hypothetical protein